MSTFAFPSQNEDQFFFDDATSSNISPTSALFPPDLSAPYGDPNLIIPPNFNMNHRLSISSASDALGSQSWGSRGPSLSPASMPLSMSTTSASASGSSSHSPHSSASPSSNFSLGGAADDFLLANSFSQNELDMLLFQSDLSPLKQSQQQQNQGLFLPGNKAALNGDFMFGQQDQGVFDQSFDFGTAQLDQGFNMPLQQSQTTIPPSWMQQQQLQQIKQAQGTFYNLGQLKQPTYLAPENNNVKSDLTNDFDGDQQPVTLRRTPSKAPSLPKAPAARRTNNVKPPASEAQPAGVGKHNKTERRYRQKVQAAQADLRDSVPALRVLYGTSSEEQKQSTDFRAPDGTVDGLGEIARPNASAKATIFLGAKLYIELLQQRVATLQRKVDELETFRGAVAGEQDLAAWRAQFDIEEAARQELLQLRQEDDQDYDDDAEDDEDDEEEVPKKKAKAVKRKRDNGDNGVRVFAAFAVSFSLLPSAATVFEGQRVASPLSENFTHEATSNGQVLSRLPLITAEHATRLLSRGLPQAVVPNPQSLVEWTWRLIIAAVVFVLLGPLIRRWSKTTEDDDAGIGSVRNIAREAAKLVFGRSSATDEAESSRLERLAAAVAGNAIVPTSSVKARLVIRLNRTARSAYSLALLAFLQPRLPLLRSPEQLWREAQESVDTDTPPALAAVLALPLEEAFRFLEYVPSSTAPISAVAEQVALVHLSDLYSRLFIRIVESSTINTSSSPLSLARLLANLEANNVGSTLRASSFEKEIRGVVETVPKGSAAHALGLVLIGLWGIFTRPTPGAQAALASALAGEELQGAGESLASVPAMLDLLFPGASASRPAVDRNLDVVLPANSSALDKFALVCIEYIKLVSSSSEYDVKGKSPSERQEAARQIHQATTRLRLTLAQTEFAGVGGHSRYDDEDLSESESEISDAGSEDGSNNLPTSEEKIERQRLQVAKEKLVAVLSALGRQAAGRATGRDGLSGSDADF